MELLGPLEVPAGESFEISLIITNAGNNDESDDDDDDGYPHELRNIWAELDLASSPNLELVEGSSPTVKVPDIGSGKSHTVIWTFLAQQPGEAVISCEVNATVHYKHSSSNPDTYDYRVGPIEHSLEVKTLPLRLSSYALSTMAGEERTHEVALSTLEPITNLTFIISSAIRPFLTLSFPGSGQNGTPENLSEGGLLLLDVHLFSETEPAEGAITISWVNFSGVEQDLNLSVSIVQEPTMVEETLNWFSLSGQVSGILLLGLFLASVVLGGFPGMAKRYFRKIGFTAKKRVDLHCNISYFIIGITLFHMLVLLAGPWGNSKFEGPLILGYVGLCMFIALGVHGRYQKQFIKKLGFKAWIWGHRLLTMGILLLALIHALRIGTHFDMFRGIL